jgi:fibronectin type 3 domain-containing protein
LTVTDDSGATDRDRVWIRVDPAQPTPTAVPQPPAAPSNVEASQRRDRVSVTWQHESNDATGFRVYRSDDGGATWAVVGEVSADRHSLRDTGVAAGGSYAYVVAAFNDAGESPWPDAAWVTLDAPAEPAPRDQETGGQEAPAAPQPPTRPADLVAKQKQKRVELRWRDDAGDGAGFRVYRSDDGGTTWNPIAELPPSETTYRDGDVTPGATYAYVVAAFNDAGESPWPDAAWVTLDAPAEPAPRDQETGGQEQPAADAQADDGAGEDGDQQTDEEAPAEDPPSDAEDGGG